MNPQISCRTMEEWFFGFAARYNQQHLENSPVHFHYVAPSFWAWKGGESRLGGLSEFVDHLFCILPNEERVCREHGVEATFVGHPVLEDSSEINLVRIYLFLDYFSFSDTLLDSLVLFVDTGENLQTSGIEA